MVHETNEALQLFLRHGWLPLLQCGIHLRVEFDFTFSIDSAQEGGPGVHEIAFAGFTFEARNSDSLEDFI